MLRIGLSDVGGDVFAILDLSGAGYDAKKRRWNLFNVR